MASELICPIDPTPVNERKVRITAAFVLLLSITWLIIPNLIIPAFLVIDFFLRSGKWGKYSLLGFLSTVVIKTFSLKGKPINSAPKKFAARIGLLCSVIFLAAELLSFTEIAFAVASILVLFAFLESVIGFCAGCYVYTFYLKLFSERQDNSTTILKQPDSAFTIE